jgi:hypothetical protein
MLAEARKLRLLYCNDFVGMPEWPLEAAQAGVQEAGSCCSWCHHDLYSATVDSVSYRLGGVDAPSAAAVWNRCYAGDGMTLPRWRA